MKNKTLQIISLIALFLFLGTSTYAQNVSLVKDINTNPDGLSYWIPFTSLNDEIYFKVGTDSFGVELWGTDGTPAGTHVLDILPGITGTYPQEAVAMNGTLYFTPWTEPIYGHEIWKIDSTGTASILKDINPGTGWAFPYPLTVSGNTIYFFADDGVNGRELWKSDGTETGTVLVKDINPTGATNIFSMIDHNGTVYFIADDFVNGKELWKSDGTAAGTVLVKDIWAGSTGSDVKNLVSTSNYLYFYANDSTHGEELWRTDGTVAGTKIVRELRAGTQNGVLIPSNLDAKYTAVLGDTLYFAGVTNVEGSEIWRTNGDSATTELVIDLSPGINSGFGYNSEIIAYDNKIYFLGKDGNHTNLELWKTDGTAAGTQMLLDIGPGMNPGYVDRLTVASDGFYFYANDSIHGLELWKSDGTAVGTVITKDIVPGTVSGVVTNSNSLMTVDNRVYFFYDNPTYGKELHVSDGTLGGTYLVADLNTNNMSGSGKMAYLNNKVYFLGNIDNGYSELFETDGTAAGTQTILTPTSGTYSTVNLYEGNNTIYLSRRKNDGSDYDLWKTDGTATNTVKVSDVNAYKCLVLNNRHF